jgi:hypothetical protein
MRGGLTIEQQDELTQGLVTISTLVGPMLHTFIFDELCKQIHEQNPTAINKKVEQMYLARSRSLLAGGRPHAQGLGGQMEMPVEV